MKITELKVMFAKPDDFSGEHDWSWQTGCWNPPLESGKQYYAHTRFPCELREDIYHIRPDGGYGTNERIFSGSISWDGELVLAMTRPTLAERWRAFLRGQSHRKVFRGPHGVEQAILVAATACERCLNALLWNYGTKDGYAEFSEAWHHANTRCRLCRTED